MTRLLEERVASLDSGHRSKAMARALALTLAADSNLT